MPIAQLTSSESSGDKSKTFVFQDEGHTLGNALRCIISSYPDVQFCGYTVPHPAESKMHFRIQTHKGHAVDALRQGLEDLVKMCDHTMKVFDEEVLSYKTEHNLAVYVWGDTWQQAKTMTECYDYLFDVVVQMKLHGLDPSLTPEQYELKFQNGVNGN